MFLKVLGIALICICVNSGSQFHNTTLSSSVIPLQFMTDSSTVELIFDNVTHAKKFGEQIHFPDLHRKVIRRKHSRPRQYGNSWGAYGGGGKKFGKEIGFGSLVFCDNEDKCYNFVHCASHSYNYLTAQLRCCLLDDELKGMCCTRSCSNGESLGHTFSPYNTGNVRVPFISAESLQSVAREGYNYKHTYDSIEDQLLELNIVVQKGTPAYGHLLFFQTTPAALHLSKANFLVTKATTLIKDKYYLTPQEAGIGLQAYNFDGTIFANMCPASPNCNEGSRYRTGDGSCNNLGIPKLGQSMTPLIRLLPPAYADGIWAPRVRKDGTPLPSPRFITLSLVPDVNVPDRRFSHLVAQFGQFIDHDLSHVPIFRFGDMQGIECCSGRTEVAHPACFPIEIPPNDPLLSGQPCLNFVRSMIAPRIDCSFGHADQLDQVTHWLDGSQIYGSTFEQAENLREFSGGLLKLTRDATGRELLPLDVLEQEECEKPNGANGLRCFLAGDKRVNEQIGITSMHTLWLREHNRVAENLQQLNSGWDDEIIYQETRRIVVAEYQHIIYNEWLPIVIGRDFMEALGILPLCDGYYNGYDDSVNPSVANAFTTAAMRFGHTIINGMYGLADGGGTLALRNFFNNPHLLREPGFIDSLVKGFLMQPIQMFDNFVTTELRDHLFENGNMGGMDLIALNLQRGRDHGIPGYNEYRDLCRLGKAGDFSELAPIIDQGKLGNLQQIYGNVDDDDIDLFIGGIHENPAEGALVGPTFQCIIADQFTRLKKADRFFYDIGDQPHSFSLTQLNSIRTVSMARIICDNSDGIQSIQPLAFHLPNQGL